MLSIGVNINDLGWPWTAIMHSITLHACLLEPTTKIWMQIDPYCQQCKCSPMNVVSSNITVMQIFAGVREIWGVKQESGRLRCRFSYLSLAAAIISLWRRRCHRLIIAAAKATVRPVKLTQCCRVYTLALARLSCKRSFSENCVVFVIPDRPTHN